GMGKTRLALEAASRLQTEAFLDGIIFVGLQSVPTAIAIPSAIAEAVGLQFYAGAPPEEQLADYFRAKAALLILDNFEHLLDGSFYVSRLLENTDDLKVLITSREALNLQGEWLYQVAGMHFPSSETVEDLENYSAA